MTVVDSKSLVCSQNHTFDFTKQGYVNLMTHPSKSQYNQELFEARHKVIIESHLYAMMHEKITNVLRDYTGPLDKPFMVVDLGCGEGSHLQKILDGCMIPTMTGIGLDISKEGIVMAAKRYKNPIWLVGDLAKSPLQDHSFHVILNILSPSNYEEFKRILAPNGLVIKVVPRSNYLKELREAIFDREEKKNYSNDKTVSLFKKHFQLIDMVHLNYSKNLSRDELINLVGMTPLAWSSDKAHIEAFLNRENTEITVDLDILVGSKSD